MATRTEPDRSASLTDGPAMDDAPASSVARMVTGRAGWRSAAGAPTLWLAVALAVSLGARLWSVGWQLPWQFHPDEGHYSWKAMDMIATDSLNPKYFRNPSLFTYLLYGQYRLLGFQPPKTDADATTSDGPLRPPTGVALVGRLTSALMGWATVATVGWLGWRLAGPWAGVASAAFLGLAFIHVRDGHYATNDVPATFLLVLSVAASLEIVRRPTLRNYLLAGVLGGLATSTKYNAGLFVGPLVLAHVLSRAAAQPRSPDGVLQELWPRTWLLAVSLGAGGLAFLAGTPYALLDSNEFWAGFRTQLRLGGEGWEGQVPGPSALLYLQALGQGLGWGVLALVVVGSVLLVRHRLREALVVLTFPVLYLRFMLDTELFFVRFALPVAPFFCLLAGCGIGLLVSRAHASSGTGAAISGRLWPVISAALAVAALVQPALDVARHNALVQREDTRVLAARWALDNVPPGAKVALEEYTIRDRRPRAYGGPSWQLDTDLFNVNNVAVSDPARALRGPHRYFIVSSFQYERFRGDAPKLARQTAFYDALSREGRLVAEFLPGQDGTSLPFDLEDLYTPFWGLDRYERPGPTIRIYEVGRG